MSELAEEYEEFDDELLAEVLAEDENGDPLPPPITAEEYQQENVVSTEPEPSTEPTEPELGTTDAVEVAEEEVEEPEDEDMNSSFPKWGDAPLGAQTTDRQLPQQVQGDTKETGAELLTRCDKLEAPETFFRANVLHCYGSKMLADGWVTEDVNKYFKSFRPSKVSYYSPLKVIRCIFIYLLSHITIWW